MFEKLLRYTDTAFSTDFNYIRPRITVEKTNLGYGTPLRNCLNEFHFLPDLFLRDWLFWFGCHEETYCKGRWYHSLCLGLDCIWRKSVLEQEHPSIALSSWRNTQCKQLQQASVGLINSQDRLNFELWHKINPSFSTLLWQWVYKTDIYW